MVWKKFSLGNNSCFKLLLFLETLKAFYTKDFFLSPPSSFVSSTMEDTRYNVETSAMKRPGVQ